MFKLQYIRELDVEMVVTKNTQFLRAVTYTFVGKQFFLLYNKCDVDNYYILWLQFLVRNKTSHTVAWYAKAPASIFGKDSLHLRNFEKSWKIFHLVF